MSKLVNFKDIVEENGKTIEENNLKIKHELEVGQLVKIKSEQKYGIVKRLTRDCDGTPLYTIEVLVNGCNANDLERIDL